jgi:hypothetical protein
MTEILSQIHNHVQTLNKSKIFAGIMIITLNIVSKFVNIKLSKTMESYLKFTFSKYLLVFAIVWIGTRDIYIALIVMISFIIVTDFLLDEESIFCILPDDFKQHHLTLLEDTENFENISEEDIENAKKIIEKAKKKNLVKKEFEGFKI